ncbi:5-bromo-4-chloroindolyl phosphate hydrolysis family protein [Niallia taxi]|uniref:Protein xpaC n=1 Tax=Niallia taxi TaxID=2499688 RepID=A0A3S2WZF5_9BACI|nr:5-bromo-4-chloroindolyl phosphate hydrolysis family protein [Niallia taxi]MCM3217909.1 5-bromo-4-chloroindolyl phosphate hydrolysis family protein [Niallia taxi]MDK8641500.1 5-bromo-4-chloroindolyl phosphate hydrolysis family protein [Niallia taxi]MED4039365.1 5-bromo-4-chloroindolyl phosphate hydrolysis family protein [Niallia taxi]MED4055824.1 5-bromo-4-chloroindolyl phosphate hydrolysis family protein [Niallia taxi]MED4121486.1 5-bromo-4-chloroindolyl phosphate hydrolysis family protein 
MNSFLLFLIRTGVSLPTGVITWFICMFAFNQDFFMSVVYAVAIGTAAYFITDGVASHRFLKKHALTRKEYKFIQKQLKEANGKIMRLNKAMFQIRHFPSIKKRIDFIRVTKKIYRLTKQEPKRFYKAEKFYYAHLDSAVEIAEKYALLSAQPKKNYDLQETLSETRNTLEKLSFTLEEDLHEILSDDIDDLHFEMDVVRHTIDQKKLDNKPIDESRRLK